MDTQEKTILWIDDEVFDPDYQWRKTDLVNNILSKQYKGIRIQPFSNGIDGIQYYEKFYENINLIVVDKWFRKTRPEKLVSWILDLDRKLQCLKYPDCEINAIERAREREGFYIIKQIRKLEEEKHLRKKDVLMVTAVPDETDKGVLLSLNSNYFDWTNGVDSCVKLIIGILNKPHFDHGIHPHSYLSEINFAGKHDSEVFLYGESGVGKSYYAEYIHMNSCRRGEKYMRINTSALTESLIESELFGYEKNAHNRAFETKKGKLEEANGGTVFIDELQDTPKDVQAILVTLFDKKPFKIQRVGGNEDINLNIRIIWATNVNLSEQVNRGTFRHDLANRITSLSQIIIIPPLNDRRHEIPNFCNIFLHQLCQEFKTNITLSNEAKRYFEQRDYTKDNLWGIQTVLRPAFIRSQILEKHEIDIENLGESTSPNKVVSTSIEMISVIKDRIFLRNGNYQEFGLSWKMLRKTNRELFLATGIAFRLKYSKWTAVRLDSVQKALNIPLEEMNNFRSNFNGFDFDKPCEDENIRNIITIVFGEETWKLLCPEI